MTSPGVLRAVLRRPVALASAGYLVLLVSGVALAPVLAPYPATATDLDHVLSGPMGSHWLGTDALGRDILSRLLYGGRTSLIDAVVAVAAGMLVAIVSGVAAGYFGRGLDRAFTLIVDVMLAIPVVVTLLAVLAVVGNNMTVAMIALGVLVAPGIARVVRGATLAVRAERYIAAARVCGLPHRHIIVRHVLPRVAGPILVQASLLAGGALLMDAGLSYLGFGARPPAPTWGNMIADAAGVIDRQAWPLIPPGIVLGLGILAFGLLGDALRDATADRTERAGHTERPGRGRGPGWRAKRGTARGTAAAVAPAAAADQERAAAVLLSARDVSIAVPGDDGPVTVVQHLGLDIAAGECVGLVGESGCGKTITGRAIIGLLPAGVGVTAGRIRFDGAELTSADARVLARLRGTRIAMVFQDPATSLDPVVTAGRQVAELIRRHHGGSRAAVRSRTLDLLRAVNFREPDRVAARYPHQLSGGMAQRVAIAMALAGEPRLLIADEPTTALDVTVQAEILDLLRRLQAERDMAILLISHDLRVIATMCQRAYVMYAGHVVESGPAAGLLTRPLHPYTAGLLGSTPRNARPRQRLDAIGGTVPPPRDWPDGCHFEPRCALATPDCAAAPVPLAEPVPMHATRCLRHELVAGRTR